MATNSTLRSIYQKAIDSKLGYDLISLTYHNDIDVGTSKPIFYSNCLSLKLSNSDCQSYTVQNCQSFIVKIGIGKNHEFIDSPLAGLFLNEDRIKVFFTRYPQDGYNVRYDLSTSYDILNILGTASPLICGFKSFTDIIKPYKANSNDEPNINIEGFRQSDYLSKLKEYFTKTDPQSITDYYVSQYISGGGDPNPGNIGFAEIYPVNEKKYDYVIAKVDLGASFKNYSKISGSKPSLVSNKYAFYIPDKIENLQQLYDYVIKDGNILMPGPVYDCEQRVHGCQWRGQGNVGLHNGQYMNSGAYGINMGNYVKKQHLQTSLTKLCHDKDYVINIFKSSALKIHELLYNSQEKDKIPVINEGIEIFNQYIDGRADFISTRYDHLCGFMKDLNIDDNNEQASHDNNEPLSYKWYDYHNPDFYCNILVGVVALAATYCVLKYDLFGG